ncbi:TrlF family AAA-like ATPase [Paenibacillus sp. FSL H7-0735]|uniref:TrlF family AAA-like ATPase n=1 Tax=Paenibacillus sp. FSL H7-0735 TaxID=2954736 RepID=UPI0030F97A79
MKGYLFPKGSEWRKWDLHVHTPASFHWKGQRFATMTQDERKASFKTMLNTINDSDVSVFGIMDYWTFDGYLEFMKEVNLEGWELKKTVLPGMELRIESPTNYRLNIHVILSNYLTEQQLYDFKSHLKLGVVNRQISNEALISLSDHLGADKKRARGFKDPENMDEADKLKFGSMVAEVTKESFVSAMRSIPQNQGYVLLPYDTSDGLSKLDWETFPISDTFFLGLAHIFETRKQETVDLFIGKQTPENADFIKDFQAALNNAHKPGIAGSDAHKYSEYGIYPSNKMTWIKADPNFNGLRQIIHEPETRVCISENKPNQKTSYLVIDKVKFSDTRQIKEFSDEWIELNDGLNVIIGGKSSGKSLLLHYIAKTIDPKQVKDKLGNKLYDFEKSENFNFEVKWVDGTTNFLKDDDDSRSMHQITYIPQLYIHQLADEEGQGNLRDIILDILLQNNIFKEFFHNKMEDIARSFKNIEQEIISLFISKEDIENTTEEISKMGDKNSIIMEIQKIQSEINELRFNSGFSEKEEEQYKNLMNIRNDNAKEIYHLNWVLESLTIFEREVKYHTSYYLMQIQQEIDKLNKQSTFEEENNLLVKVIIDELEAKLHPTMSEISNHVKYDEINLLIAQAQKLSEIIELDLSPFLAKFKNKSRAEELQKSLDYQMDLLNSITESEKQLILEKEKYEEQISRIIEEYSLILNKREEVVRELNKSAYNNISEDMKLKTTNLFDTKKFFKQFTEMFNRQKKLYKGLPGCFDENDEIIFTTLNEHELKIKEIFLNILTNNELKLKSTYELKAAVLALFSDYYYFDFNLSQKNDSFIHMSPGKRGMVLLQLFLHLSNSTHPILIDQPEDNLDNRTIYTELNGFIKSKKINRQIIIVTHNANLVVLTDAEQVIVANQAGQQVERENEKYRFEYVSGALECTFIDENAVGTLYKKGIKEHVCEILEGGQEAFEKRERKYGF